MKLLKRLFKHKLNNKGVTLVELVCALAILSCVGAIVVGVMYVSTQSYSRSTLELDVQQEAQFATNLINSYVMDAKEVAFDASSSKLTIKHTAKTYEVVFADSDSDGTKDSLWISDITAGIGPQLLAEKVSQFDCDTSRFSTDKALDVALKITSSDKNYESRYSVTARNADVTATDLNVSINAPRVVVLEPGQSYTISPCEAVGAPSGSTITWTIVGGATNSSVVSKNISVGLSETASEYSVVGSCKSPEGTEIAKATIKVYIRRVTGISLTATLVSGTDLQKNAVYEIVANISGRNLDEKVLETGYVNPYQVDWSKVFSPGDSNASFVAGTVKNEGSSVLPPSCQIKLNKTMAFGEELSVTAKAKHSSGTNKTGTAYDSNIKATWKLMGPAYTFESSKLYRGTNLEQGNFAYSNTLKGIMHGKYGHDAFRGQMYYRYREVHTSGDVITWAGSWSEWRTNPGDANDSIAINLRPSATQVFHPSNCYELEMLLCLWDYANNRFVWPGVYTPYWNESVDSKINKLISDAANVQGISRSVYIIRDMMRPVTIEHSVKVMNTWPELYKASNVVKLGTEWAPYEIQPYETFELIMSKAIGIETNLVKSNLEYVVQQKVGGVWTTLSYEGSVLGDQSFKIGRYRWENGKMVITCGRDQNNKAEVNASSRDFRILVKGKSIDYTVYAGGENYYHTNGDCDFFDWGSGNGIFYFRCK